jgi:hypothetical protein
VGITSGCRDGGPYGCLVGCLEGQELFPPQIKEMKRKERLNLIFDDFLMNNDKPKNSFSFF